MKQRRQTKSNPQVYTAGTGDPIYDSEDSVASDAGYLAVNEGTSRPPIVGRTPYDLMYEHGLSAAGAKLLRSFDAVEILGTTAYILFGLFMKSNGLVMRFWLFCVLLAGYHWVVRPLGGYLERVLEDKVKRRQSDRNAGDRGV